MVGRIGVIGSCMMDLVTYVERMPEAGETLVAPRFAMGFGGKGANQAVAAALLGSEVMMVAKVGDDPFGESTAANFRAHRIDCRFVEKVAGVSNGVAPIFVEPSGENRILIIKGANDHLRPADIDRAEADLLACDLILLQLEIPLETIYHAVALAARAGRAVLLNPAPASPALDLARLRGVTFLVPNQSELRILTNRPTETPAQAEAAARMLLASGIGHVIVTLGAAGALWVSASGTKPIPALAVAAVDTTGAGDAFIGSFAHYYARSRDIAESLRWASRYAADAITRPGTQKSFADAARFAAFCAGL